MQSYSNATLTNTYTQNDVLSVLGPAPSFDGENTKQVQNEYDGLGRLSKSCHIGNGSSTACGQHTGSANGVTDSYTYTSSAGFTETSVTRGSQTRDIEYDGLGRVIERITPEAGTWIYTYDNDSNCVSGYRGAPGQLASVSFPTGNFCYKYDALNRVIGVAAYNGTACRHFYYDTSYGTVPTGVTTPTYTLGRLAEASTDNCSGTLVTDEWFSYDKDGRATDMWESTPNSGTYYHSVATFTGPALTALQLKNPSLYKINYGLDGEGRWNSVAKGSTTQASVPSNGFNAAGQLLTVNIGQGSDSDVYTYDSNTLNMLTWDFTVNSVSETATLTWNPIGTLKELSITDGFNSGGTQDCKFGTSAPQAGYDDWNRLLYDDCGSGNWGQSFSYDVYDNLTKAVISGRTGITWNPGYSSSTNQATGNTYDSNGNTTNDSSVNTYEWNEFSRMKSANRSGTNCATSGQCLVYDALGRVVEIDSGSTKTAIWYTQLGKTEFMNTATNSGIYAYWPTPGGGTILYTGNVNYMHKDWLGSARVLSVVSSTPSIVTDRAFAPYGEVYDIFGGTTQRQTMFGGGSTQDVLAGVYNTPNRELAGSNQGRWLSLDPAGSGWNRYAYTTNPNSSIDPTGLSTWIGNPYGSLGSISGYGGTAGFAFGIGGSPTSPWTIVNGQMLSIPGYLSNNLSNISGTPVCDGSVCNVLNSATGGWLYQQQQQLNPDLLESVPTVPSAPVDGISCSGAQIPCSVTLVGGGDPNKSGSAYIWTEVLSDAYGNPIAGAQVDEFIISGDGSFVRTGTGFTDANGEFSDILGWTNVPTRDGFSVDLQFPTATMNGTSYPLPQMNWIKWGGRTAH